MSDERAQSRRHVVADELERRGLDESAAVARWKWEAANESQARMEHEEALRQRQRPAEDEPILWELAAGIVAAAALTAISEPLLRDSVDRTVHTAAGDSGPNTALDGEPVVGLSTSEFAADLGSVELGPLPSADVAPGVALGDQLAAAEPTPSAETVVPAAVPSVEVGGSPDLG